MKPPDAAPPPPPRRPPPHTLLFLREIKTAKASGVSFLEPVTGLDPFCRSATWDVTRIAGNPFLNMNSFTHGSSPGLTALTSDHIFASFPSSPPFESRRFVPLRFLSFRLASSSSRRVHQRIEPWKEVGRKLEGAVGGGVRERKRWGEEKRL